MITKTNLLTAILCTLCLTTVLFTIIPVNSTGTYDLWADFNDDGGINVLDLIKFAEAWGTSGTPINKTQMLLDLQNRVSVLEEKQDYVKTLRLYQAAEVGVNDYQVRDVAVFTWVPRNATNNAVYGGCFYLQYMSTDSVSPGQRWILVINDNQLCQGNANGQSTYTQTAVLNFAGFSPFPQPNLNQYTIKVQCSGLHVRVKDINILLEVMDGLPPS